VNEEDLARFESDRWKTVTSIGMVRINPLGDCVISLSASDGQGIVMRLFDPERSLDALSQPEGHHDPYADLFRTLLWYINENAEEDIVVGAVFFFRRDDRWRAMVRIDFGKGHNDHLWSETEPRVALSTFSVDNVPSFIESDESSMCDLSSHREALLFGLRGGDDVLEGLRSSVMRSLGITIKDIKGETDEA